MVVLSPPEHERKKGKREKKGTKELRIDASLKLVTQPLELYEAGYVTRECSASQMQGKGRTWNNKACKALQLVFAPDLHRLHTGHSPQTRHVLPERSLQR
jgi:hypothetical protein